MSHFDGLTIGAGLRETRAALLAAQVDGADIEARWMLEHLTGFDHAGLISNAETLLSADLRAQLQALVADRKTGRPIGRVLGWSEFYGRRINVSDATLDPRADTEALVDAVLDRFDAQATFRFADIGTGTGAIGISIACERPHCRGVLTDISSDALKQAAQNVSLHQATGRLEVLKGDLCEPLNGQFDLIVSNPPYIRTAIMKELDAEVRDHDPALALDGGADGLNIYRRLIDSVPQHLSVGGYLMVEIGFDQADALQGLLAASGALEFVALVHDLGANPRVVVAQRR